MWFSGFFVVSECFFLTSMAHDWYLAIGILSGLIMMVSHVCILVAIWKIQTAHRRQNALPTCSSHLVVVSILYGTLFFISVRPGSSPSLDINKVISLLYTVVMPMLNPLVYSLGNKEDD
ncbi:olfactory receptor 5G29-like isoform X2 [Neofelis nebulosa]|uniref:olfactory receptor 5G29-like n=1 Tax=Neofelis nebulosa TaxID=61452 RepID=UPI00272C2F02|nr:olfactory receptor 5G29-like [Neofelis nebulosa]XP_058544986.1 olfactory receptor 5G29-like isoform X2 [Neofelis nebulosa]